MLENAKKDLLFFLLNSTKKYLTLLKLKNTALFLKNKGKKNSQASKTVKNPNNDDKKSVTVRHSKTAFNLLKPITQSKIITEELETVEKPNIFDNNKLL